MKVQIYMKVISIRIMDVVFVKVGTELDFPNKCLALWPDYDNMTKRLKKMFIKFDINDERFLSDLTRISEMLRGIVLSRMEYSNSSLVDIVSMVDDFVDRNREILLRLSETNNKDGQG